MNCLLVNATYIVLIIDEVIGFLKSEGIPETNYTTPQNIGVQYDRSTF